MAKADYIFLDIEGSGLDTDVAEILEIAAIRADGDGTVITSYSDRVKPTLPVSPEAAAINGYTEAAWADAVPLSRAIATMRRVILSDNYEASYVVVAHFGESYDRPMLRNACKRLGVPSLLEGRGWVDTGQMAWPMVLAGFIRSRSLECVSSYLGIQNQAPHTAKGDVTAAMSVYWEMMRRYKISLLTEQTVRTLGGEQFDSFRRMFGF